MKLDDCILCYVTASWAYFTDMTLDDVGQYGDSWHKVPYEHNADPPYENGHVFRVAWDGEFKLPNDCHCNSPYSINMINDGHIAWLRPFDTQYKPIHAGTTFAEFKKRIIESGGKVYMDIEASL